MEVTPVILPSGRLRLFTKPSCTGSSPVTKTIGIVLVAALAATSAVEMAATTPRLGGDGSAACEAPRPDRPTSGINREAFAFGVADFA